MSTKNRLLGVLITGAIIGSTATYMSYDLLEPDSSSANNSKELEKTPLYWVAPMDANYKRDKPGKSPMGMDLIPVYQDGASASDSGPGTITISPEVVNNLGVRTAKAKFQPLHTQISTVGYVKYDEDQLVHIHPRVEGWVEKLYVKTSGAPVTQGEPLYDIYSPALVNAQEELLLALERKNQRLIQAAEDRLAALQLPKVAIKQLKSKRQVMQRITFYAPQSGVVDNLNIREGFFVKPGTTLMSIGRLDQVWVEAEVFERQASEVAVGIPVTMTLAYLPGKQWQGKVDYVYPTLNAKNRTVKLRLRFENEMKQLKPNMFAQVVIHADDDSDSLLIPKEAVIRTGTSERVVIALGEGRFKSVNVKTGRFDTHFAEILSGINVGDTVVTSAQFLLDSESSKSSDFKRMHHQDDDTSLATDSAVDSAKNSATVKGVINSVITSHRMLNISREAIEKWGRAPATLDFLVSESIDLSTLKSGMAIQFTFHVVDGEFMISKIKTDSDIISSTDSNNL